MYAKYDSNESGYATAVAGQNAQPTLHSQAYPVQQDLHGDTVPVVVVQPGQQPNHNVVPPHPRPPNGQWADGICDWPKNLFPSCYCACCFCSGMWLVGQMSEKTGYGTFSRALGMWAFLMLTAVIIQLFTGSAIPMFIPLFYAIFYAIGLRMHIVRSNQIRQCGGSCGECCVGFWCFSCSVSQMARYLYGYNKAFDGDSDINRPDNYAELPAPARPAGQVQNNVARPNPYAYAV
jgi:hypothetical protein